MRLFDFITRKYDASRRGASTRHLRDYLRNNPAPEDTFFIIIMPGGLHLAKLALDFMPKHARRVIILNGADAWEADWARRHLAHDGICRINAILDHWDVLDVLFDEVKANFGILDYDCYVFDSSCFERIAVIDDNTAIQACFYRENPSLELKVPETFFLFFNTKIINRLRKKYEINCSKYRWHTLPEKARAALPKIGLGQDMLPETHKPYFDTLRGLMMLSLADGVPYRYIEQLPASPAPSDIAFHVGGVSDPRNTAGIWALRGSYFWRRALETQASDELRTHYYRRYGKLTAAELLNSTEGSDEKIDPEFLEFCETIIYWETRSMATGDTAQLTS